MSLAAEALRYNAGSRTLLDDVSLTLEPGQVHAVLGPNGAGKSTLLKLLAGDLRGDQGVVRLAGRPLQAWPRQQLARHRAVLPQVSDLAFDFTARQVVMLGRTPCMRQTPAREAAIVDEALAIVDATHLQSRSYLTLSGGERARVQLARVLAQIWQPVGERYLLLDEPTASLDLAHQHACLRLARRFAAGGVGVLVVLHDPNLALAYADQVSLLCCGQLLAQGAPMETLNQANLEKVYGVRIEILQTGDARQTLIAVRP